MFCRERTLVKHLDDEHYAVSLYCRSWQCTTCKENRSAELVMSARAGKPTTFITLTTNPDFGTSPEDRAAALARAWRLVRLRAMRLYKLKRLPFLAVFEATKNGEPHLHILTRVKWLDQKWLSDQMAELIGAPIVDIRRIKGARQVARYVSKYVGKDPHRFGTTKRYWSSRDFEHWRSIKDTEDKQENGTWYVSSRPLWEVIRFYVEHGFAAHPRRDGYVLRPIRPGPA